MLADRVQAARVQVELLAVGDELLFGDIVNGNAAWLGRQLADVGIVVRKSAVVGDDVEMIAAAVHEGLTRADAVILTGGLGPTQDDLTREGLARAAGVDLRRDPFLESMLRRRFRALGREGDPYRDGDPPSGVRAPEMNYRQADVPEGAQPLPNEVGTAPGIRLEIAGGMEMAGGPGGPGGPGGVVYAMPGVPHEMYPMFTASVLPDLLRRAGEPAVVVHRVLRTAGVWESVVAEKLAGEVERLAPIGNPRIAFLASDGQTRVRISARAADRAEALALIEPVEKAARVALGDALYGVDDDTLEGVVLRLLAQARGTLAVAESVTGGLVAGRLTDVPGASAVFRGGVVSYATEAKASVLGVDADLLAGHGAVSPETAAAMAGGVRDLLGTTHGLAVTGVAGPDEQEGKPVGTLHIGIVGPFGVVTRSVRLPGDRRRNRTFGVVQALDALRRTLSVHTR